MSNSSTLISVNDVSKTFKLPHEKQTSIKGLLINKLRGNKSGYEQQRVLNDISFTINKGEFVGIVGRNGSGKSTLLKLLAGIYVPSQGNIAVEGKLTPFIELGVGFNPELTGRENVYLNGALLGFNRKEMEDMYENIVSFAELEKFMDQKLKNYSSGMQVRLAFSIAIRARSDILLLDEVLAVGDAAFQKKCFDYFYELKKRGTTVCFVSHDMSTVERFCSRAIYIEAGKIIADNSPGIIADLYREKNEAAIEEFNAKQEKIETVHHTNELVDLAVSPVDTDDNLLQAVKSSSDIILKIEIQAKSPIEQGVLSLTIEDETANTVIVANTYRYGLQNVSLKKNQKKVVYVTIQNILGEGNYAVDVELSTLNRDKIFGHVDNACALKINDYGEFPWLLRPKIKMEFDNASK